MNIRDLQATLKQRTLRPGTQEQSFFKLIEEVGQLAEALRARARYLPDTPPDQSTIDEELADVIYALFTLANLYSVDLQQAITIKEQLSQLRPVNEVQSTEVQSTEAQASEVRASEVRASETPPTAVVSNFEAAGTPVHHAPPTTTEESAMPSTPNADMKTSDLKVIAGRFIEELWNQRSLNTADALFAETCVTNQLRSGAEPITAPRPPAAVKKQVNEWVAAFPDFRYTVRQMLSEGDKVMIQCVATGTHQGTWLGIPATNKTISIETMITQRIVDGKIVEDWVLADFLGLFQQLGLVAPLQELLAARKN